ncbi:hypothetical protein [Paenibacillus nuruki]|uniref:Y-family DNA polymerase n=1 Tax=Paenibacillus nuruki TaxID=1886670 RepID=UPI003CCC4321
MRGIFKLLLVSVLCRIYIIRVRMGLYIERSMRILDIVYRYAPSEAIQTYSIGKSFFTTLHFERIFGSVHDVAISLKRETYKETETAAG